MRITRPCCSAILVAAAVFPACARHAVIERLAASPGLLCPCEGTRVEVVFRDARRVSVTLEPPGETRDREMPPVSSLTALPFFFLDVCEPAIVTATAEPAPATAGINISVLLGDEVVPTSSRPVCGAGCTVAGYAPIRFGVEFSESTPELDEPGRAALEAAIAASVERALDELDAMWVHEGALLRAYLDGRKSAVLAAVEDVAASPASGEALLRERLAKRVNELAVELATDPTAVAPEVVRFAARSDISEEVVRFRAHVQQWSSLSDGPEPCGRKVDFLLQEMNREVNTIGSKANDALIARQVVMVKAEFEKIREQIQNVE